MQKNMHPRPVERRHLALLASLALILAWSAIRPHDYFTWMLEVFPAVAAAALLIATYRRFRFTNLAYTLMWIHAIILIVGGHYTYAQVPLFNWIRDEFGLARNNYDKVGHFAQGFIPAIVAREILLRTSPLRPGKWLSFLVVAVCLALSAFYEFIEWWVALATGESAESFLGTQGYIWDTQSDMFYCTVGAIVSLALLSRRHDQGLARLRWTPSLSRNAPGGPPAI
jgi:putative membrane protein